MAEGKPFDLDCKCQDPHCNAVTKVGRNVFGTLHLCDRCYETYVWRRDRDDSQRRAQRKRDDDAMDGW